MPQAGAEYVPLGAAVLAPVAADAPSLGLLTTGLRSTIVDQVEDATRLAGDATAADPEVGLAAVAALRRLLDQLEALQVDNARAKGWRWSDIACAMGASKQAVHRKHAPRLRLLRR